jgi:hypothetical protein
VDAQKGGYWGIPIPRQRSRVATSRVSNGVSTFGSRHSNVETGMPVAISDFRKSFPTFEDPARASATVACPGRHSRKDLATVENHDRCRESREKLARNMPLLRLLFFVQTEQHSCRITNSWIDLYMNLPDAPSHGYCLFSLLPFGCRSTLVHVNRPPRFLNYHRPMRSRKRRRCHGSVAVVYLRG